MLTSFPFINKEVGEGAIAGQRIQVGFAGPRKKSQMQGRRGVFLPCVGGRRMQQSCKVYGRARACYLHSGV